MKVYFKQNQTTTIVDDILYQWDKNQVLEIEGLDLKEDVKFNFSIENISNSKTVTGVLENGIIKVDIPNFIFEHYSIFDYVAYAYIYQNGETTHKIKMPIKSKPKPEDYGNVKGKQFEHLVGNSTDIKPTTNVMNGSSFFERDTGKEYLFDEENQIWYRQ